MDLSLVRLKHSLPDNHHASIRFYSKANQHIADDSINMGTRFDCLDKSANVFYPNLSSQQKANPLLLRNLMISHGFKPYYEEWWHFTLAQEPFPDKHFNFPVR